MSRARGILLEQCCVSELWVLCSLGNYLRLNFDISVRSSLHRRNQSAWWTGTASSIPRTNAKIHSWTRVDEVPG